MIIFTDANSAKAFEKTMDFTIECLEQGIYRDKHTVFLWMVAQAMAPDRVVYIFHGDSDAKKQGIPAYFDWAWFNREVKDAKYGDYLHEFPTKALPQGRDSLRVMNGGWMNHGTAECPQWSSHS
jgi:hypothetical protein